MQLSPSKSGAGNPLDNAGLIESIRLGTALATERRRSESTTTRIRAFTSLSAYGRFNRMGAANEVSHPADNFGVGSRVLDKVRELGLSLPLDLERLAMARGCGYYERDLGPLAATAGEVPLSNVELAIALLAPSLQPTARQIRLAAALLGAADDSAVAVATLAAGENCAGVLRYIASCGSRFEPRNPFWTDLLDALPETEIDRDRLPHPTRFVEMTGIDRGKVGTSTRWVRARNQVAA
jgi:hypothetical protein